MLAPANWGIINATIFASTSQAVTVAGGAAALGTVAGMIAYPDFRDAVVSSSDPAHLSGLFAAAGEFLPTAGRWAGRGISTAPGLFGYEWAVGAEADGSFVLGANRFLRPLSTTILNDQGEAVVRLTRDSRMLPLEARAKAAALQELSDQGVLVKAPEPVARDPAVTEGFRQDMIDRIWNQYGSRNREFAEALIDRVTTRMSPDHVWELQLGGPDTVSHLRWLDRHTNELFGRQIRASIRGLRTGTRIRIQTEGF